MVAKRKAGGFKGALASFITIVLVIGAIVGWARTNEITTVTAAHAYFKNWSDAISECGYIETITGQCKIKEYNPGYENPDLDFDTNSTNIAREEATTPETINHYSQLLESLTVEESKDADYDRASWKHWTKELGSKCNTRQVVLKEQGNNVVVDERCKILSGTWIDPYTGNIMEESSKIDIDHVIPLGWANANGGSVWDTDKKEVFANDRANLLATSQKENRRKGSSGPSKYMPPDKGFHCYYSQIWIKSLENYDLSVPQADYNALEKGLSTCK